LGATAGLPILIKIGSINCATLTSEFQRWYPPRDLSVESIEIENPQAPAFIRGVNLKSKIKNQKSIDRGQLRMTFIGFNGFGKLLAEWHTPTHYQIRPEVDAGDTDTLAAYC
jgi:hypothetical protein